MTSAKSNAPQPDVPGHDAECSQQAIRPWPWPVRAVFLFTGVVLPFVCFLLGFPERPDWQSGSISAYAQLLLSHKPSIPLYPFLLYNMTSMTLVVLDPDRFGKNPLVRFGVYTGVPLAAGYWVVFQIATEMVVDGPHWSFLFGAPWRVFLSLLPVLVPIGLVLLLRFLARKFDISNILPIGIAVIVCLFASTGSMAVFLCLLCATPWAVASYAAMSILLFRGGGAERLRFTLAQLMGVVAWAAAWLGAWRGSFLWMLHEYSKLPTSPPDDCYVSTAAARGHRRLVGSEEQVSRCGKVLLVNAQMRYLKAAELLLASVSPGAHRGCRWVYDRIGPVLASALVHPVAADAAYLGLKPAEWLARGVLALVLPEQGHVIRGLYEEGGGGAGDTLRRAGVHLRRSHALPRFSLETRNCGMQRAVCMPPRALEWWKATAEPKKPLSRARLPSSGAKSHGDQHPH
ncbi:MAG: hypothetical protein HQ582_13770 [Planctomycetes bacterium]|nr:hypothetical protein [Planctomycetota bacterium]